MHGCLWRYHDSFRLEESFNCKQIGAYHIFKNQEVSHPFREYNINFGNPRMFLFQSQVFDSAFDKFNFSLFDKLLEFAAHNLFNVCIINSIYFYCSSLNCKYTQDSGTAPYIQNNASFTCFFDCFFILFHPYEVIEHIFVDRGFTVTREVTFVNLLLLSFNRYWIMFLVSDSLLPFCFGLMFLDEFVLFNLIFT